MRVGVRREAMHLPRSGSRRPVCALIGLLMLMFMTLPGSAYIYHTRDTFALAEAFAKIPTFAATTAIVVEVDDRLGFSGGGTLIAPNVVLTAYHVVRDYNVFFAGVGKNSQEVELVAVSEVIRHPLPGRDLALLILETPILSVKAVRLRSLPVTAGSWIASAVLASAGHVGTSELLTDRVKRGTVNRLTAFGYYHFFDETYGTWDFESSGEHRHELGGSAINGNSGDGVFYIPESVLPEISPSIADGFNLSQELEIVGVVIEEFGITFTHDTTTIFVSFNQDDRDWMSTAIAANLIQWSQSLDSDHDTYNDYYEHVFGGDPLSSEVVPPPVVNRIEGAGGEAQHRVYFVRRSEVPLRDRPWQQRPPPASGSRHHSPHAIRATFPPRACGSTFFGVRRYAALWIGCAG